MHSYQHNIKTFNSATLHLTRVERSLYRDLIELYYDTEQPLPAVDFDRLARRVRAFSEEEIAALKFVLSEFFERTGDVYTHDFCDEEIEKYHNLTTAKARAGKASAEARRKKANERKRQRSKQSEQKLTPDEQVLNKTSACVANHEPGTRNQEPDNITRLPAANKNLTAKDFTGAGLPTGIVEDFIQHRKNKKAPITRTAMRGICKQAKIAGWNLEDVLEEVCNRGWTGFKAEWVMNDQKTWAERNQDYQEQRATERYKTLLSASDDELIAWGLK